MVYEIQFVVVGSITISAESYDEARSFLQSCPIPEAVRIANCTMKVGPAKPVIIEEGEDS